MQTTACEEASATPEAPPQPRTTWWRRLIWISAAALVLWLAWNVYYILGAGNVHEVIPGKLYRGAQPSGKDLEKLFARYKIRTVLNARGCCYPDPWYLEEAGACQKCGVHLEDISFSAVHLPSRY